jgi:hypothetical protein
VAVNQWKTCLAMIEVDILPIACIMAARAIPSHLTIVYIHMTGRTISGCTLKGVVLMAICARNTSMFTK